MTLQLKVLRFVLSEINYAEIDKQAALTDEEIVSLIQKEIKKRKQAIDLFKKGNRLETVVDEEAQIAILRGIQP
ncbi:GatB/YqeY domain-containing protein [Candidatus Gottesmanbacteria bacterium]|nr:GatB/YqeY domain-containing protein [Candidatus Gottesmanbacteria bacterium]